jgi:hypothetical protein
MCELVENIKSRITCHSVAGAIEQLVKKDPNVLYRRKDVYNYFVPPAEAKIIASLPDGHAQLSSITNLIHNAIQNMRRTEKHRVSGVVFKGRGAFTFCSDVTQRDSHSAHFAHVFTNLIELNNKELQEIIDLATTLLKHNGDPK